MTTRASGAITRTALGFGLALGGLCAMQQNALAEDAASPSRDAALAGTVDELAGWAAIEENKWVRARELGERILREHPDSFAGHYILGVAMHYGEGDLARSVRHLEEAARRFEARYGARPPTDKPWRWHEATLKELAFSLNEIDRPDEELAVLERYDAAYNPKRVAQRVWPLMKLHRYDDARAAATRAIATGRHEQQIIARSDLCAAECEAGDRERALKACTDALAPFDTQKWGGQVEFSNASEAALSLYRFDEAEKYLAESTKRAQLNSWGNPFQHLAVLYLDEGRLAEAIDALKGGQELRLSRPAWLDQHGQSRLDWTVAAVLLVVGETERAEQIAERADLHPDRQGVHSGTEDQSTVATAILVATAEREQAARLVEAAASAGIVDGAKLRWRAIRARVTAWHDERRAAALLANEDFLVRTLRPYYVGGADLTEWLIPELIHVVGPGVFLAALQRAREADVIGAAPAYYDAFTAEAELLRGHLDAAREAADAALQHLPSAEGLLRARVAAVAAVTARRAGDANRATERFSFALAHDPDVLRRLGVALPVRLHSDGSVLARKAADLLESSPRFDFSDDAGHTITLEDQGGAMRACLLGPGGAMVACADVPKPQGSSPSDNARALVAALHKNAFAIKVDLTQADLTSLDGSPTAARADKQVKSLLSRLHEPEAEPESTP